MTTVTKTVRLPEPLAEAAEAAALQLGLTFNDIVEVALSIHLKMPANKGHAVLIAVRDHLVAAYPNQRGFPQDVTLDVFRRIQSDKHLWSLYQAAVGPNDEAARDSLHRKIGKAVKAVLGAKVDGRSLPLDPAVELIRSHALLSPGHTGDTAVHS